MIYVHAMSTRGMKVALECLKMFLKQNFSALHNSKHFCFSSGFSRRNSLILFPNVSHFPLAFNSLKIT